jgi:hypothetical protein
MVRRQTEPGPWVGNILLLWFQWWRSGCGNGPQRSSPWQDSHGGDEQYDMHLTRCHVGPRYGGSDEDQAEPNEQPGERHGAHLLTLSRTQTIEWASSWLAQSPPRPKCTRCPQDSRT